ncbi:MAG: DivIVA domain-containing protein [Acidimicrobiia bacterium]|nr:DivIVA domain-containing protein [Acidimicrobiia bacterium]
MDLTPDLLRNVEFNEARKGGYDHDDVDEFLDRAATELTTQHARLRDLDTRIDQAERRAAEAEAQARQSNDSDETLRRTLVLAQRTADAAIKEAQDDAARITAEARQGAAAMVAAAEESVRRDVGATRDRLQAEIGDLETHRDQLGTRIAELTTHVDVERARIRDELERLRASLDSDAMAVAPAPGVDPSTWADATEPDTAQPDDDGSAAASGGSEATADRSATDDQAAEELSELPPPPVDWAPSAEASSVSSSREWGDQPVSAAEDEPRPQPLFDAPEPDSFGHVDRLDLSDGGPPTQATPVVDTTSPVGASHLDELRRAVSDGPEDTASNDDAAMAAFFDQDDEEDRRRFGRRR